MIHYPWNLLLQTVLKRGTVDIHIHGLEELSTKEIFDIPSVSILREIKLQLDNPDLTDHEKVEFIQELLER